MDSKSQSSSPISPRNGNIAAVTPCGDLPPCALVSQSQDSLNSLQSNSLRRQLSAVSERLFESSEPSHISDNEDEDEDEDEYEYEYEYSDSDSDSDSDSNSNDDNGDNDDRNGGAIMMNEMDLTRSMNDRIKAIIEVFAIPKAAAMPLFRKHKWNAQRVEESFNNDREKTATDAGVYHRCIDTDIVREAKKLKIEDDGIYECLICCEDDLLKDEMFTMQCGHQFCRRCWSYHIEGKMKNRQLCIENTCMDGKCKELITEEEINELTPQFSDAFMKCQLHNFVDNEAKLRWCPGPDCNLIASLQDVDLDLKVLGNHGMSVCCEPCNITFCFGCGDVPHEPITCNDQMKWSSSLKKDGTHKWILANTKACPKCAVRIEKNSGCNHMTCEQCRHEFCWICNQDYATHRACNTFEQRSGQDNQRELDRDLHYLKRYHNHDDAHTFAENNLKKIRDKFSDQKFAIENEALKEPLIKANEQLVQCRRRLKNTYIFAHRYLHKTDDVQNDNDEMYIMSERFEYQQGMLETHTEELNALIEQPLEDINRQELINKYQAVKTFSDNIVKLVVDEMYHKV